VRSREPPNDAEGRKPRQRERRAETEIDRSVPHVLPASDEFDAAELKVGATDNPLSNSTVGDLGLAVRLDGPESFPESVLVVPLTREQAAGIDLSTTRLFFADEAERRLRPVWNSGVNESFGFAWAKVRRPGVYVPIGLPRDRLLRELLRSVSEQLAFVDARDEREAVEAIREAFAPFLEADEADLADAREALARLEIQTGLGDVDPQELRYRTGMHIAGFALPRDATLDEFRKRVATLEPHVDGLPELDLFHPPDEPRGDEPLWERPADAPIWSGLQPVQLSWLRLQWLLELLKWLFNRDWWMYHADERHTGRAKGWSDIRSTNVHQMRLVRKVPVDGPVFTIPSIVGGKVYVGTSKWGGTGGSLFKIDAATGNVDGQFTTSGISFYGINGIGGSPAIVDGKVFFTTVYGDVYCLDASTMTTASPPPAPLWVTSLKVASAAKNQPINNPEGDCWSGPLVVNGRVYVGSGEGESSVPYGFIWCLDASNGRVIWVFCTNKFVNPNAAGNENAPNVIPASAAVSNPLPGWATAHGFSIHADPPNKGAAVWSSCAYDEVLSRVYVCTGNSRPDTPLPDERYASGIVSLDATTGAFQGFFQPAQSDSYRPGDFDVDVPCAPTVFGRGGTRVVAFGSKNGSFFLLDANTMQVLGGGTQKRQLLPKDDSTSALIETVDPTFGGVGENKWGVMATAAVDPTRGRMYVGLGGYMGIDDHRVTPFLRVLDWNTLADAWPTVVETIEVQPGTFHQVRKYATARPPLYTNPGEAGLSSPALVNDVIFMSTSRVALYALDATTGLCLWSPPGFAPGAYSLGPAISGNYVVLGKGDFGAGADNAVYIYVLGPAWPKIRIPREIVPWWRLLGPWPGPEPEPFRQIVGEALREQALEQTNE
jgi:outer membrane protein assembly factor BamB